MYENNYLEIEPSMTKTQIGLIGLGPMGIGLAKNLAKNGFEVIAWDKDDQIIKNASCAEDLEIIVCEDLNELVALLEPPRCIFLSILSGPPVGHVLTQLEELLSKDDVVADCGNSYFQDTQLREEQLRRFGIAFLGVGVSGGPEGARRGPSIMAGGSHAGWKRIRHTLEAISAKVEGEPCCKFLGPGGSGHFVKIIHNGIEYGVMHLLMEIYAILSRANGNDHERIAKTFEHLNSGLTESFLIGITALVAAARRPGQDDFLIDVVDGRAEQKGTGLWAVKIAMDLGMPVPTISEAVMSRQLSSVIEQHACLHSPDAIMSIWNSDYDEGALQNALSLALVSTFAQGMSVLTAGTAILDHELDVCEVLKTWRRGCILQGALIELLLEAASDPSARQDFLRSASLKDVILKGIEPLRRIIADAVMAGVPCSGLASSLAYIESKRGSPLPTSLIQLQRDYFGQHGIYDKQTGELIIAPWKM